MVFQGKDKMDSQDAADEIRYALEKHAGWDKLFLSDNFKGRFKNRKSILGNIRNVENIDCYSGDQYGLGDVVVITVDYRTPLFKKIPRQFQRNYTMNISQTQTMT